MINEKCLPQDVCIKAIDTAKITLAGRKKIFVNEISTQ